MHPTDDPPQHGFYLMCDDLDSQLGEFRSKGVEITRPVSEQRWGRLTAIRLPSGAELPLYEPLHPLAHGCDPTALVAGAPTRMTFAASRSVLPRAASPLSAADH